MNSQRPLFITIALLLSTTLTSCATSLPKSVAEWELAEVVFKAEAMDYGYYSDVDWRDETIILARAPLTPSEDNSFYSVTLNDERLESLGIGGGSPNLGEGSQQMLFVGIGGGMKVYDFALAEIIALPRTIKAATWGFKTDSVIVALDQNLSQLYESNFSGSMTEIWRDKNQAFSDIIGVNDLVLSPDKSKLAVVVALPHVEYTFQFDIYVIDLNTTNVIRITDSPLMNETHVRWRTDNTTLTYLSNALTGDTIKHLTIQDTTMNCTASLAEPINIESYAWSADEQKMLLVSQGDVYLVSVSDLNLPKFESECPN